MLVTNNRFVQAQDPTTAVARPRLADPTALDCVTPAAYRVSPSAIPSFATRLGTTNPSTTAWTMTGRKETKVDFHDRWPLHSTS